MSCDHFPRGVDARIDGSVWPPRGNKSVFLSLILMAATAIVTLFYSIFRLVWFDPAASLDLEHALSGESILSGVLMGVGIVVVPFGLVALICVGLQHGFLSFFRRVHKPESKEQ